MPCARESRCDANAVQCHSTCILHARNCNSTNLPGSAARSDSIESTGLPLHECNTSPAARVPAQGLLGMTTSTRTTPRDTFACTPRFQVFSDVVACLFGAFSEAAIVLTATGVTAASSNWVCSFPWGVELAPPGCSASSTPSASSASSPCVPTRSASSSAPAPLAGRASSAGGPVIYSVGTEEPSCGGCRMATSRDKRGPSRGPSRETPGAFGVRAAAAWCESRRARSNPSTALSTTPLSGVSASVCCVRATGGVRRRTQQGAAQSDGAQGVCSSRHAARLCRVTPACSYPKARSHVPRARQTAGS